MRIARPVTVNRNEWEKQPAEKRRERLIRDEEGRPVLLRLIEQQ